MLKRRRGNFLNKKEKQILNHNRGFSMVELIIIIAIMGIVVGVVGTQVMPYMERAREARDKQILSSVATAVASAIAMEGVSTVPITSWSLEGLAKYDTYSSHNVSGYAGGAVFSNLEKQVAKLLLPEGTENKTGAAAQEYLAKQFASRKAKENSQIYITYFPNEGKLYIFLGKEHGKLSDYCVPPDGNGIWYADDEISSSIPPLYVESN